MIIIRIVVLFHILAISNVGGFPCSTSISLTPYYLYLVKSGHLAASLVQRRAAKISRSWCDSNYSYSPSLPQLACAATLASQGYLGTVRHGQGRAEYSAGTIAFI